MTEEEVDLECALALLSLPRELGIDPENGHMVVATNGRYGTFVKRGDETRSIPAGQDLFTLTLEEAIEIFKTVPARKRRGPEVIREMGTDPSTERVIRLLAGRFGPYVADGETNASLPKGSNPEELDLEAAIELIRKKELAPKRPRRGGRRKSAAKKKPAAGKKKQSAGKKKRS